MLLTAGGAAIDYTHVARVKKDLQTIADASAVAGAREFRLGNSASTLLVASTTAFANDSLAAKAITATVDVQVDMANKTITVTLASTVPTFVMKMIGTKSTTPSATATAKVVGGAPICALALETKTPLAFFMQKSAKLQAPGCAVYSDSTNAGGMWIQDSASLTAAFTCTAGGSKKISSGTVTPTPQTDCPPIPDPLAARSPPPVGSTCDYTNHVVRDTDAILSPGVYCGGLQVLATHGKTASATLKSGVYVIKDGPLVVGGNVLIRDPKNILVALDGDVTFSGTNVGFYFLTTNPKAALDKVGRLALFKSSHVSLTAPKVGAMTGILFFEDRNVAQEVQHFVTSDDTRQLLGTIYLPKGDLLIDASKPVADKSAYTIVVARKFLLSEGPTMVLNANYDQTDIPVPEGVGPNVTKAVLWR